MTKDYELDAYSKQYAREIKYAHLELQIGERVLVKDKFKANAENIQEMLESPCTVVGKHESSGKIYYFLKNEEWLEMNTLLDPLVPGIPFYKVLESTSQYLVRDDKDPSKKAIK